MEARIRIRIEDNGRGAWEVSMPDDGRTIVCETLEDARRAAFLAAAHGHACELIVRDADHHLVQRELIPPPPQRRPCAPRSVGAHATTGVPAAVSGALSQP
jgi:hypothetical protein